MGDGKEKPFEGEWRAVEGSAWNLSPLLYKENGFSEKKDAEALMEKLGAILPSGAMSSGFSGAFLEKCEKKKEQKNPPLLYNLAELQNDCSRMFKISPDETLKIAQELYEKKLTTYPRTDARVLSSAVAKEIHKNIGGLRNFAPVSAYAVQILEENSYQKIAKTRYKIFCKCPPACFSRALPMMSMPNRNKARPPSREKTLNRVMFLLLTC